MSNPTKGSMDTIEEQDPYYGVPLGFVSADDIAKINHSMITYKRPEQVFKAFEKKNVKAGPTVFHDMECTHDATAKAKVQAGKPAYVLSPMTKIHFSVRTRIRARAFRAAVARLDPYYYNEEFKEKIRSTFHAGGGSNLTIGRLLEYLPGRDTSRILPPSAEEAERAVMQCGWDMGHVPKIDRVLIPLEDSGAGNPSLRINKHAMLGSPFFAVPAKDPEVLAELMPWARGFHLTLREAYSDDPTTGVQGLYRQLRRSDPKIVTSILRTKTDFVSEARMKGLGMRPYAVSPAIPKTLLSQLIQTAERFARNALDGSKYMSAQRMGMSHGNVNRLVRNWNAQYQRSGYAFSTAGDDGVVFVKLGPYHVAFETDMSSFDNTQLGIVKEPLVGALANQLALFSPEIAQAFFESHRVKGMVLCGAANLEFFDGGCTGLPGQGEINDLINNVYLNRLRMALNVLWLSMESAGLVELEHLCVRVNDEVVKEGTRMGLVVKITNFQVHNKLKMPGDMLEGSPMKFLGYYIGANWSQDGDISVRTWIPSMDPERFFARVLWKTSRERPSDADEIASLAGMALSLGSNRYFEARWWGAAYAAFQRFVLSQLQAMHESNTPFPSHVEHALNGLAYVGVVGMDFSWKSLAEAIVNIDSIWDVPLDTEQPYRMSHNAAEGEDGPVEIPLYKPKRELVVSSDWADAIDEPVSDPQTAAMPSFLEEGPKSAKVYTVKPMLHVPISDKHVGRMPPTHLPRPPTLPKPAGGPLAGRPKRAHFQSVALEDEGDDIEDLVEQYAQIEDYEPDRWEEEFGREDRSASYHGSDKESEDEREIQDMWEDPNAEFYRGPGFALK